MIDFIRTKRNGRLRHELAGRGGAPGVVAHKETYAIADGGMIVEEKNIERVWRRIGEVDFTGLLKGTRRGLPGVGNHAVHNLLAINIGFMLDVAAESIARDVARESEHGDDQQQCGKRS